MLDADKSGSASAYAAAQAEIDAYNEQYPDDGITSKNIRQVMRAAQRQSDNKEHGVALKKSIAPYINEATAPSIYRR